ncbi:MAG: hypothetical protein EBX40_05725 [Gammaproteobacteria bacterium]|nr:hypothetical protein [Gammaproteobacteria bacterium]
MGVGSPVTPLIEGLQGNHAQQQRKKTMDKSTGILAVVMRAKNWQGGTIWQAIQEIGKYKVDNQTAFNCGVRSEQQFPNQTELTIKVPIKSWNDDPACNMSYLAGIFSVRNNKS